MKKLTAILLCFILLLPQIVMAQTMPNDTYTVGQGSSTSDKGFIFNTGDGASNKKLLIEDSTKLLKFDGNSFQLGDGADTDKEIKINGASKSLKYNATTDEFEFNDDVKLTGGETLKTDYIDSASGTETAVEQDLRAKGKIKVGTGNNEIRVSGGNLEYSNDGSNYKKLGSGSGGGDGGTDLLLNGSFEDLSGANVANWTVSGGTLSRQSNTSPAENDLYFGRFVATTSGQYIESAAMTVPSTFSAGCYANINFKDGDSAFKIQVIDGSSNVLKEYTVGDVTAWQPVGQSFPCPSVGSTFKIKIISTGAGTIDLNKGYGGDENRTFKLSQAQFYAGANYQNLSCQWSTTSASWGDFPVDSDCVPTLSGNGSAPDTRIPAIKLSNAPAGSYLVVAKVRAIISTTGDCYVGLNDSATEPTGSAIINQAENRTVHEIVNRFNYTSTGDRTIRVVVGALSGSPTCVLQALSSSAAVDFSVYYYPTTEQVAMNAEAAQYRAAATITAVGSDQVVTFTASTDNQQASNANLTLANDTNASPVEIACASTASSGATCSGSNEAVGITINAPVAGVYQVCHSGSYYTTSNGLMSARIDKVTEGTTTVLESGRTAYIFNDQGTADTNYYAPTICDYFTVTNAGRHSFKAMQNVSTATAAMTIGVGGTSIARPSRWTVELVNHYVSKPVLVSNEISNSWLRSNIGGNVVVEACKVNNNGTATMDTASGLCESWLSSVTYGGSAGNVTYTPNGTAFTSNPVCVLSPDGSISTTGGKVQVNSTTQILGTTMSSTTVGVNGPQHIFCMGKR